MIGFALDNIADLLERGGAVMWVLLGLSVLAVTLGLERSWFWLWTNHPGRVAALRATTALLRRGDGAAARRLLEHDRSVYGRLVRRIAEVPCTPAAMLEAVEAQRPRLERFMPTLSTVITAAPMLGILGTVIGLISALNVFAGGQAVTDPRLVSPAIGEALITTAAGLVVALVVLFPYNGFRAQIDRTLGRIEMLAAAAEDGRRAMASAADVPGGPDNIKRGSQSVDI